jgi:DNA-binding beta-propeller fold protein YncE
MKSTNVIRVAALVVASSVALGSPVVLRAVEAAPRYVLVVNTQDASVSLVDLESMREVKRHPVGPRPYGIAVSRDCKTVAVGVEDEECVKFFSLPDFKFKGHTKIGQMYNDHIVVTPDAMRGW